MLDGPFIHDSRLTDLQHQIAARDNRIRELESQVARLVGPWDGITDPAKRLTEQQLRLLLNLSRVQWWVKSMAGEVLKFREANAKITTAADGIPKTGIRI